MYDIFISYSRKDLDFVNWLVRELSGQELSIWVDQEGIAPTEKWMQSIYEAIEASNNFVFIISPDSLSSEYCQRELLHAIRHNKRLIPILRKAVMDNDFQVKNEFEDEEDEVILEGFVLMKSIQYIDFREQKDQNQTLDSLVQSINTNPEWAKQHTRWLQRAREWEKHDFDKGRLLTAAEVSAVQDWLDDAEVKIPEPTQLHKYYLIESEIYHQKRKRRRALLIITGIITVILVSVFAFIQFSNRRVEEKINKAIYLTEQSRLTEEDYPIRSMLLGISAYSEIEELDTRVPITETRLYEIINQPLGIPLIGNEWIDYIALSPNGRYLAGAGRNTVLLWNADKPNEEPIDLLQGKTGDFESIRFGPDGNILVSGSKDIWLWNINELKRNPIVFHGHESSIYELDISPDKKWMASLDSGGALFLWEINNPQANPTVLIEDQSNTSLGLAFSPDGKWLASGDKDCVIKMWSLEFKDSADFSSAICLGENLNNLSYDLAFSPDGEYLASAAGDDVLRLWKTSTISSEPMELIGHNARILSVSFSLDGKLLVTGLDDGTVQYWNMNALNIEPIILTGHKDAVFSLAFNPDNNLLASGGDDDTIRLWDLKSDVADEIILRGQEDIRDLIFSPDSKWLYSSGLLSITGRAWNIQNLISNPLELDDHASGYMDISPDGKWLTFITEDNTIYVVNPLDPNSPQRVLEGMDGDTRVLEFSPDGLWLIYGVYNNDTLDNSFKLWNLYQPESNPLFLDGLDCMWNSEFHPNGELLVLSGFDVHIWKIDGMTIEKQFSIDYIDLGDIALSPDGKWLAIAKTHTIELYDVNHIQENPFTVLKTDALISRLTFSHNSAWLAASGRERYTYLWDVNRIKDKPALLQNPEYGVYNLVFSPDDNWLVGESYNYGDSNILWNLKSKKGLGITLVNSENDTTETVFDSKGNWLASGINNEIHLWNLATPMMEPVILAGHEDSIIDLEFHPEDAYLFSSSSDNTIRMWNIDLETMVDTLCDYTGRNFSNEEWGQYFPDREYKLICPQWPEYDW